MGKSWYNIFGKSTAVYTTWVIAGILTFEFITGSATDMAWNSMNKGKTYDSIDWSVFKVEDDDEDEDDDDDDEEEGDDDNDDDDDDDDDEDGDEEDDGDDDDEDDDGDDDDDDDDAH